MTQRTDPARPSDNTDSTRDLADEMRRGDADVPELDSALEANELDEPTYREALSQTLKRPDEFSDAHLTALVAQWANTDEKDCIVEAEDAIFDGRAWLDDRQLAEFYEWVEANYGTLE